MILELVTAIDRIRATMELTAAVYMRGESAAASQETAAGAGRAAGDTAPKPHGDSQMSANAAAPEAADAEGTRPQPCLGMEDPDEHAVSKPGRPAMAAAPIEPRPIETEDEPGPHATSAALSCADVGACNGQLASMPMLEAATRVMCSWAGCRSSEHLQVRAPPGERLVARGVEMSRVLPPCRIAEKELPGRPSATCNVPVQDILVCSQCKRTQYCSAQCQGDAGDVCLGSACFGAAWLHSTGFAQRDFESTAAHWGKGHSEDCKPRNEPPPRADEACSNHQHKDPATDAPAEPIDPTSQPELPDLKMTAPFTEDKLSQLVPEIKSWARHLAQHYVNPRPAGIL